MSSDADAVGPAFCQSVYLCGDTVGGNMPSAAVIQMLPNLAELLYREARIELRHLLLVIKPST